MTDIVVPTRQGIKPSISFSCSEMSQDMFETFDRFKRANISTTEVTSFSNLQVLDKRLIDCDLEITDDIL